MRPDGEGRILLGSFTYQTPHAGADTIVFSDPPSGGTFVYGTGTPFDQLVTGGTVSVAPVPEPATVLAVGVAGLAGLGAVRRVRRRSC